MLDGPRRASWLTPVLVVLALLAAVGAGYAALARAGAGRWQLTVLSAVVLGGIALTAVRTRLAGTERGQGFVDRGARR